MIAIPRDSFSDRDDPSPEDPSPEEIIQRAAAIRRGWSDAQRKRRRAKAHEAWLPPLVAIADVAANMPTAASN